MVLAAQSWVADPSRIDARGRRPFWTYAHVPAGSSVDQAGVITEVLERFAPGFSDIVVATRSVPASDLHLHDANYVGGDIGVGGREVGFMAGMMKKLSNNAACVFTGRGLSFGGSLIRPEATGYGAVYFAQEMLATEHNSLESMRCVISGSGNVAQFTAEKLLHLGAIPVSFSDSDGTLYDPAGIDDEKLAYIKHLKNGHRGRIREYADHFPGSEFRAGQKPWSIPCEATFPSATQNELNADDARTFLANGCRVVSESANMPSTPEAVDLFLAAKILYGPGKRKLVSPQSGRPAHSRLQPQQPLTGPLHTHAAPSLGLPQVTHQLSGLRLRELCGKADQRAAVFDPFG
jgi:glutamate dehydrogenase/leucine dehydrogenase